MNKAEELIQPIIEATDEKGAIDVLVKVAETLHLSQNYSHLVTLKDSMEEFKDKFKGLSDRYRQIPTPRPYNSLHELRMELSFLFRDFTDGLAFEINKSKIYHEERKTEARAIAMVELKEDPEFQKKIKATSTSALRDILGASNSYKEFITLSSFSYGLYQEYQKMSDAMKMLNDALASECREAQYHDLKDAK
jgi:hypothetical protein